MLPIPRSGATECCAAAMALLVFTALMLQNERRHSSGLPGIGLTQRSAAPPRVAQEDIPAASVLYTVTDLGAPGGLSGQLRPRHRWGSLIPGSLALRRKTFPGLFKEGAGSALGTLGGRRQIVHDRNDRGQVVGEATTAADVFHAFLSSGGRMQDLGTLGADPSNAVAINNSGQVAGWSATAVPGVHAFLFSAGVMRDLGTLGGDDSEARAINEVGQIAGSSRTARGDVHAFLAYKGVMSDLRTLGGNYSDACDINDAGQVVGLSITRTGAWHAFLSGGGVMQDLGALGGGSSEAFSINNSGRAVGWSLAAHGRSAAWLSSGGEMIDLNRCIPSGSGWHLSAAYGISDAGQIIGFGSHDGRGRAFLLTPRAAITAHAPARPPVAAATRQ